MATTNIQSKKTPFKKQRPRYPSYSREATSCKEHDSEKIGVVRNCEHMRSNSW